MRKQLTICVALLSGLTSFAQEKISDYIQKNTVSIQHVDPSKSEFEDLVPVGKAIGDARIVMLGEQEHGDAPAFLAKSRLVRYLHEEKGFNVLAFESDMFGLTTGWEQVSKEAPAIDSFLFKNIFPIWALCDACQYLFHQYIPATQKEKKPLAITGFDNQVLLSYSQKKLVNYLDSTWRALDLPTTKKIDYDTRILSLIRDLMQQYNPQKQKKELFESVVACMDTVRKELAMRLPASDYNILLADNLIYLAKELGLMDNNTKLNETRDEQMARNLEWLVRYKFANEKIIVWAASTHILKYSDSLSSNYMFVNMGTRFLRNPELRAQTYVMGFTSGEGTTGLLTANNTHSIASVKKNSVEKWMDVSAYSFVDFASFNKLGAAQNEFWMKGFSHYYSEEKWNRIFDGVFYIREMYPCKRAN
jgi:erythromycin esterase